MNTLSPRFPRHQRGMALISVLAVLLLLTLLVVAFMSRTTSARAASSSYHATASTRLLADTAVNLVQAQINEATTRGIAGDGSAVDTWASQPGAIRVFNAQGTLDSIYRLYSATPTGASSARVATSLNDLASDIPSDLSWSSDTAQWVDLNAFAQDSQGKYHFPIVDPRDPAESETADPTTVKTIWKPKSGVQLLKGFSINPPSSVGINVNPAPMPVRWLYILKDGSIISPDNPAAPSNQLTFAGAVNDEGNTDVPTVKNPIVGRIAFWTDDETSKININTAAGDDVVRSPNQYAADSIFWAPPVFSAPDEVNMAVLQPANGEIQRYSGHPGTVGLNATLSALLGLDVPLAYNDFYGTTATPGLLPRYTGGGSVSGTVAMVDNGGVAPLIPLTANRLYPSVAEMLFRVDANSAPGQDRPVSTLVGAVGEVAASAAIERSNFFLTAHSSASELNLFGEPRVSVWPYTTTYQTPIDQLLAFDSTIARTTAGPPAPFYFQRTDPTSSITDCNIAANSDIFSYLDNLTSRPIPGFGPAFTANKYPNPAMHQILGEIFDYIRTINVLDPVLIAETPANQPSHAYGQNWGNANASIIANGSYRSGAGGVQVVPSANNGNGIPGWGTQGVAAFPVPVEVTIDFAALGKGKLPAVKAVHFPGAAEVPIPYQQYSYPAVKSDYVDVEDPSDIVVPEVTPPAIPIPGDPVATASVLASLPPADGVYGLPADGTTAMQAFIYVTFVNPSVITSRMQPMFCYSLDQIDFTAGGVPLHFPGNSPNLHKFQSSPSSEMKMFVDNSDGGGYINGWIGNWLFGYICFDGETGNSKSNPGMLGPATGLPPTAWGINNTAQLAPAASGNAPVVTPCRYFPFYSQIFCLPGQQGWSSAQGNAGNPNNTFAFSGGIITLRMYDAHKDLDVGKVVNTYKIEFPAAQAMPLPGYSAGDSHIIGTLGNGGDPTPSSDRWHYTSSVQNTIYYKVHISDNDTVQSMVLSPAWSDARILSVNGTVPVDAFTQHPLYGQPLSAFGGGGAQAHDLLYQSDAPFIGNVSSKYWGRLVTQSSNTGYNPPQSPVGSIFDQVVNWTYPIVPPALNGPTGIGAKGPTGQGNPYSGAYTTTGAPGDWDNGIAWQSDGPWVNMADEGALVTNEQNGGAANSVPYYSTGNTAQKTGITSTFSPNRQMPSPAMFGSLPTGVSLANPKPWQTLLFRPGAGAGGFGRFHPGEKNQPSNGDPADYLLLDLFWMPQAEPYPISQPFVTEGKINLNYEIQPFTYITRDTALRALLTGEKVAVMPDSLSPYYKKVISTIGVTNAQIESATGGEDANGNSRLPVDVDQTLGLNPDPTMTRSPTGGDSTTDTAQTGPNAWYDSSTGQTHFFRTEAEVCDMFLVPKGYDWNEFSGTSLTSHSWYKIPGGDFALVGDNTRERPYVDIYSRVTTKSNTYTVYYTVQSLRNAEPQTDAAQANWDETKGAITGEYRGATTLERYLDPNETMPDFFGPDRDKSLEPYYKWRVISTRQFAP